MSDRMLLATRKGLLQFERGNGAWRIARTHFPGVAVTAALADARDGTLYAMLKHGHFGSKLHRSDDGGAYWNELPAPAFAADAAGSPTLFQVWTLEAGSAGEPGRLWAGALPAGLFVSSDRGEHWSQVSALWNVPEREKWFGGGYDDAGIHTVSPDPRDANRVFVAISCGGVWDSNDAGASWTLRGDGMVAAYMPPELAGQKETQDPHRVARCAAAPDVMWMQHHCGIFRSTDAGAHLDASSNCRWTISALRLFRIRKTRSPPGSCPPSRTNCACRATARSPYAHAATAARPGRASAPACRSATPTISIYRHGLDVDATGTQLAMGSTTGSLWVSDNAGEAW